MRDLFMRIVGVAGFTAGMESRGTMMERLAYGKLIPYGGPLYAQGLSPFEDNLVALRNPCIANNMGRRVKAITDFEKAIGLSTTAALLSDNRFSLAFACLNAGNSARTIEQLRQIRSQDPTFPQARDLLHQLGAEN